MSQALIDLSEQYEQATQGLEQATLDRVYAAFDASLAATRRQIEATFPKLQSLQSSGQLTMLNRQALIAQELAGYLKLLKPEQAAAIEADLQQLLQLSTENGQTLAEALTREIDPRYPIAAFSKVPIDAVAAQARDFRDRLYRYSDQQASLISGVVEQGLAQGLGIRKVTAQLNQLGVSFKSSAETVARTESMSAFAKGSLDRYERSGISYVQWIATPSERLCSTCAARNQQVYRRTEVYYPPHARCRCSLAPWRQQWQAEGLLDEKFSEQYRQEGLDLLAANGATPNNGLAPFEKGKLASPPPVVWRPGDPPLPPEPIPGPKPAPPQAHARLMAAGNEEIAKLGSNPTLEDLAKLRQRLLKQTPSKLAKERARAAGISADALSLRRAANGDQKSLEEIRFDLEEFHRLTGATTRPDVALLRVEGQDRAWSDHAAREINLGGVYSESTLFHELAHLWERDNPALGEAARSWRDSRATGEAQRLNDLVGADLYNADEMALPGRFANPYVGKVYADGSTEVVSVGMEHFVTPRGMQILLENDPEHFAFLVGAMREAQSLRGGEPVAASASGRMFSGWNGYRPLTPVEEAMQRAQASRAQEFQSYLRREEESIRRRTSGEIDRKLREYHDAEAARLRESLGIPSPPQATPAPTPQGGRQQQLNIRSYDREVKPVRVGTLEIDEGALSDKGKAALTTVRQYEQVLGEINAALGKIPGPDKQLPADAYSRIYDAIDNLQARLSGLVNEAKAALGTSGNPDLEARLSQIGKISKEGLPGYKIQTATEDLAKKSAVRPC